MLHCFENKNAKDYITTWSFFSDHRQHQFIVWLFQKYCAKSRAQPLHCYMSEWTQVKTMIVARSGQRRRSATPLLRHFYAFGSGVIKHRLLLLWLAISLYTMKDKVQIPHLVIPWLYKPQPHFCLDTIFLRFCKANILSSSSIFLQQDMVHS